MGFFKESMFNRKCIWNKLIEYIYKILKIHHVPETILKKVLFIKVYNKFFFPFSMDGSTCSIEKWRPCT